MLYAKFSKCRLWDFINCSLDAFSKICTPVFTKVTFASVHIVHNWWQSQNRILGFPKGQSRTQAAAHFSSLFFCCVLPIYSELLNVDFYILKFPYNNKKKKWRRHIFRFKCFKSCAETAMCEFQESHIRL